MRTAPGKAQSKLLLLLFSSACAGSAPAGKQPEAASGQEDPRTTSGTFADASSSATTTDNLPSGATGAAKLEPINSSAADSGASPGGNGRAHEPGRGAADIRAIIIAHRGEVRDCYDSALPAHPGLEGDLVVQWTIDPKGNVTRISIDSGRSQINEPSVTACVEGVIRKIQFATSPGGYETSAVYPFNFHPRHGMSPLPK
jgi:hypothetical protein